MELSEAFQKIAGRPATDAELQAIFRAQSALGIKENDSLMILMFALEHYRGLYGEIPEKIAQAAAGMESAARAQLDAVMISAVNEASGALTAKVAAVAAKIAGAKAAAERSKWLSIAAGVCAAALFLSAAGGWMVGSGGKAAAVETARAEGLRDAMDTKAAAQWAATDEGRAAYKMWKSGTLTSLVQCSGAGWYARDGFCFPGADRAGNITGWRLP